MSKIIYVGPTIIGVATRNTVYDGIPEPLVRAAKTVPYVTDLCIPISKLSKAMEDIRNQRGQIYRLYQKATVNSKIIQEGAK